MPKVGGDLRSPPLEPVSSSKSTKQRFNPALRIVDMAAVRNPDNQNTNVAVVDFGDNPVVSDTISPEIVVPFAAQR